MPGSRPDSPHGVDFWNVFRQFALSSPRRVSIVSTLVLTVMGVGTGVLARNYHEARRAQAAEYFATAERDLASGRNADAAVHYRAALSLERDNGDYRRRLAVTLLDLRLVGEAESRLDDLLAADPVDGEANLLRGRVAASRGNWGEAEAYYQRAIYGRWPDPTGPVRRLGARYELVELFEQIEAIPQARAELLRLQSDLPEVPFLQEELAQRFLRLGDPEQAARLLRRTFAANPESQWLAADLSRAELAAGQLSEARDAARRALALDPNDRDTRTRLAAVTDAITLDPNARGLSERERQRRSRLLLIRAVDALAACAPGLATPDFPGRRPPPPAPATEAAREASARTAGVPARADAAPPSAATPQDEAGRAQLAQAQALLDKPSARGEAIDEQIAARLTLADQIWRTRLHRCGPTDAPIAVVFDRLPR